MNQLYAIRNDGINYQELDLEILDILDMNDNPPANVDLDDILDFNVRNTAMKSWWPTPDTKFKNIEGASSSSIPDISYWIDASLVLSPKAYRMLGDMLQPSGEFLPVSVGKDTYYIFNLFVLGEADVEKCKHDIHDDIQLGLNHLEFKESAAQHLIFKSTYESCLTVFCSDRFKNAVEDLGLKGIIFDTNLIEIFD